MPIDRRTLELAALGGLAAAALGIRAARGAAPLPPAVPSPLPGVALRSLGEWHRRYPGARRWRLGLEGIEVEGQPGGLVAGADAVLRSWNWFGQAAAAASVEYGVPLELVLATLATESVGGAASRAAAARARGTSGEVGVMQTLPATARAALGKPRMLASALLDPLTSIRAGTAYIAWQRMETGFDPPLVGAAYNAGRLREDRSARNPWRLRCHPVGTGGHVGKFVRQFGDAMALLGVREDRALGAPSFSAALRV